MEASQYGEDPDSAYGDEVYVQFSSSEPFLGENSSEKVNSMIEGVSPHHWHPTSHTIRLRTTGDITHTKKAVRRLTSTVETTLLIQIKATLTPMMRFVRR